MHWATCPWALCLISHLALHPVIWFFKTWLQKFFPRKPLLPASLEFILSIHPSSFSSARPGLGSLQLDWQVGLHNYMLLWLLPSSQGQEPNFFLTGTCEVLILTKSHLYILPELVFQTQQPTYCNWYFYTKHWTKYYYSWENSERWFLPQTMELHWTCSGKPKQEGGLLAAGISGACLQAIV